MQNMDREQSEFFVALDRDGTINVEANYLSSPDQIELLPGAAEGMRRLHELGGRLLVVTNQSGIGRGYFSEEQLQQIHQRLCEQLSTEGVTLSGIYHAADHPDQATQRRKPGPGMLLEAAEEFGFDPSSVFVVGDKPCDVQLGQSVGATTFLVRTGYGRQFEDDESCQPDYIVDDLCHMARVVERLMAERHTTD